MGMANIRPLAEGIPLGRAWREGRRVYVICSYQSTLSTELRALGAKWDRETVAPGSPADSRPGALWVGSGKADQVTPLVLAHLGRITEIETAKTEATIAGRW